MPETPISRHEETISSERGFDGKLVHVRVDHVLLPSGKKSVREVVEHPGAVGIVALSANQELILVRQWRHAVGRSLLEIPAGTREPNEPTIQTAQRELLEETGYEVASIREIARYYSSAGFCTEELTIFLAEGCTSTGQTEDVDERTEIVLIPRDDIRTLLQPAGEQIHDSKSLAGILWLLANHPSEN